MVQEPWIHKDRVRGLNLKGYKLLYAKGTGNIRSCILAKNSLNIFILSDYSDGDTTTIALETLDGIVRMVSGYMAHDHGQDPHNGLIRDAVIKDAGTKTQVIICADANAHHTIWGSTDTNTRSVSLFSFIMNYNLGVVNRDCEPTFVVANRCEVLYVTLVSIYHIDMIENWMVCADPDLQFLLQQLLI